MLWVAGGNPRPPTLTDNPVNFTCVTAREITYNSFEISLVVFMPNITTNHAMTNTKYKLFYWIKKKKNAYNSNSTAQSGKNNACVSPAPCIPINMSELWVIWE